MNQLNLRDSLVKNTNSAKNQLSVRAIVKN